MVFKSSSHNHDLVSLIFAGITASWYGCGGHLGFSMWPVRRAGFLVWSTLPRSWALMSLSVNHFHYIRPHNFHDMGVHHFHEVGLHHFHVVGPHCFHDVGPHHFQGVRLHHFHDMGPHHFHEVWLHHFHDVEPHHFHDVGLHHLCFRGPIWRRPCSDSVWSRGCCHSWPAWQ